MMSLRNKTVNVDRKILIEKIKEGLIKHEAEYQEAIADYKLVLCHKLATLLKAVELEEPTSKFIANARIKFDAPESYKDKYAEAIEMLEFSVDENINLDEESFRAYVKNQWSWSSSFAETMSLNKSYIGGAMGHN